MYAPIPETEKELALVLEGRAARKGAEEVERECGEGLEDGGRVGRDEGEKGGGGEEVGAKDAAVELVSAVQKLGSRSGPVDVWPEVGVLPRAREVGQLLAFLSARCCRQGWLPTPPSEEH